MKSFSIKLRLFAFLLSLLLILPLCACGKRQGKVLLTLDHEGVKVTFSVNHYQFLLSRLRGNFVLQGVENSAGSADQAAFWNVREKIGEGDALTTWDAYYRQDVLETCKTYLVGLWVFEKNKLTLSDSTKEAIEEEMADILAYHGDGSKAKLNSYLADYGVNYDLLKSFYEMEAKVEAALQYLYGENASLLGDSVKNDYLAKNYFHYKRILFSYYKDSDNTENDTPQTVTDEEQAALRAEATELFSTLQDKTEAEFETAMEEKNGTNEYTDGYYLPINASIGNDADQIAFFSAITQKLAEMEIGEVALLELSDGIQILRKYEPTPGAYDLAANALWFSSFANNLMRDQFGKDCLTYTESIAVDETVLASAPTMKEISPNVYF